MSPSQLLHRGRMLLDRCLAAAGEKHKLATGTTGAHARIDLEAESDAWRLNFRLPRVNGFVLVPHTILDLTPDDEVPAVVDEIIYEGARKLRGRALLEILEDGDWEVDDWDLIERVSVKLAERYHTRSKP